MSTHIIFLKILITIKMVRIMVIRIMIIKMIRIMVIIGQECPVPAGGQMGSVWKWRLLMNTGTAATLWHRHRHCCYTLEFTMHEMHECNLTWSEGDPLPS